MMMHMQDEPGRTRVKVPEAARIMGVSVDTIRRRIRSGALKATQKKTSSGHVWLVELPEGYSPSAAPVQAAGTAGLEDLRREISELRREVREVRELLQSGSPAPVLPWLQRRPGAPN